MIIFNDFNPFYLLKNKHIQTILPYFLGFFYNPIYKKIRINVAENESLVCDTIINQQAKMVILVHGLEGSSNSHYIKRMASKLEKNNFDVCAINLRGCGGHPNHSFEAYHSGKTDDLHKIILYFSKTYNYQSISLVGYSLGGNLVLKYIGENRLNIPNKIKKCIAISAPIHLLSAAQKIDCRENIFYKKRFLKSLINKVLIKKSAYPNFDYSYSKNIQSIIAFDHWYTAPAFGFKDSWDYYTQNSALQYFENITIPTLLIAAKDDPFLDKPCFYESNNKNIKSIYTNLGGHVGFLSNKIKSFFWLDTQILNFLK